MANTKHTADRETKWIRWIARGIGLLNGLLWLFQVLGISPENRCQYLESIPFWIEVGLLITPMLGVIIAWRWEGIGGVVLVISAIAALTAPTIAYAVAGRGLKFVSCAPVLFSVMPGLPGFLFLICWSRTKSSKASGAISGNEST
jgi:hypothetical protein